MLKFHFFFQFGNNSSTLLLFETNILDVFKVEILIESNFWLGMYVIYNFKWSLYPKIEENQCFNQCVNQDFVMNTKHKKHMVILNFHFVPIKSVWKIFSRKILNHMSRFSVVFWFRIFYIFRTDFFRILENLFNEFKFHWFHWNALENFWSHSRAVVDKTNK